MWSIFAIFLAIPAHFASGAPADITLFWEKEPCSLNKNVSKSFNEAKKMCNRNRETKPRETDEKICKKLETDFSILCKSLKDLGEPKQVPQVMCTSK